MCNPWEITWRSGIRGLQVRLQISPQLHFEYSLGLALGNVMQAREVAVRESKLYFIPRIRDLGQSLKLPHEKISRRPAPLSSRVPL